MSMRLQWLRQHGSRYLFSEQGSTLRRHTARFPPLLSLHREIPWLPGLSPLLQHVAHLDADLEFPAT